MGVHDSYSGEDRAILCRRKKLYENARNQRSDRWFRETTRNWTPVTFTFLNPTDSRTLEKTSRNQPKTPTTHLAVTATGGGEGAFLGVNYGCL